MRRYAPFLLLALAVAPAFPAVAAAVGECTLGPESIAEPWSAESRTFANGVIRVAHMDTGGEPVCCPSHLLVLAPAGAPPEDYRVCHMVSARSEGPTGFLWVDVPGISSSYDPERGLLLTVPTRTYEGPDASFAVRINQATGAVTLE